jgi:predicted negative regulator of RcsB-dependent stress response
VAIKIKQRAEAPAATPQEELRSLTERFVAALRPYLRQIAIGATALVLVVGFFEIWGGMRARKAGAATAELGKVLDAATATVEEGGPDLEQLPAEPEPAKFKTFKDRAEAEVAAVQALDATYGGSPIAKNADLVAAAALYDLGKLDEAAAKYRAVLAAGPGEELAALAHEGLGHVLEAKALAQTDAAAKGAALDEAAAAYGDIERDEKGPHYNDALYHQARIKAIKGDNAGAIELYKKVLARNPNPMLGESITGRLALLGAAAK